jgi:glutathione S-transferase
MRYLELAQYSRTALFLLESAHAASGTQQMREGAETQAPLSRLGDAARHRKTCIRRSSMKLYYDPITVNCRKVLAGFDLMGVKFETGKVDYFAGGHKQPEYVAINPNASLPTLVDDDFTLWESNAILQYTADKVGATAVYPKDLKTRADISRWHLWESSAWFPSAYAYLVENVVKPIIGQQPDNAVLEAQAPTFHKLAGIIEQRLSKQPWLCGNSVTLADIVVAAPMHLHPWQKLPLEAYPSLRRWIWQVEALPCWKNTDPVPIIGLKKP